MSDDFNRLSEDEQVQEMGKASPRWSATSGGVASDPVRLVPTKSDKEIADELRKELIEVYKPVIEILTKAKRAGFEVAVTTGADGFQQVHVMSIGISKVF